MLPCIAFVRAVKGGYIISGVEVPTTFALTLPDMTPEGNPILLAPNANQFVNRLESREDEILGIWTEKFKQLRDECLNEASLAVSGDNREEAAAYLFAVSNLSDTLWFDCFRDVARSSTQVYSNAYSLYKLMEEEVLATDGWKKGPTSGPLTNLIRRHIENLTGITLTDSEVKAAMDNTPDCGDPNCPVHGGGATQTGGVSTDTATIVGVAVRDANGDFQTVASKDENGNWRDGTDMQTEENQGIPNRNDGMTDGDIEEERLRHQRSSRNRDRETAQ